MKRSELPASPYYQLITSTILSLIILGGSLIAEEVPSNSPDHSHALQNIIRNVTDDAGNGIQERLEQYRDLAVRMHGVHLQIEQAKTRRLDQFSQKPVRGLTDPPQTSTLITVDYIAQSVLILNREFTGLIVAEALFSAGNLELQEASVDTLAFSYVGAESQVDLTLRMLVRCPRSLEQFL